MDDARNTIRAALKPRGGPRGKKRGDFAVVGARGNVTRGMMRRKFDQLARRAAARFTTKHDFA